MRNLTGIIAAFVLLFGVAQTGHAIPQLISFQGILTDGGGTPITVSTNVEFRIWDMSTGGAELWMESQSVTPNSDGLYQVLLGSVIPIPESAFEGDAYLGLTVPPDPEMNRLQLVSVGYSFRTGTVDGATGGEISSQVSIGPLHGTPGLNAFVAGYNNDATGDLSTISGGSTNGATNTGSTVGGGTFNHADGLASTVAGGEQNIAAGARSTIGGGLQNTASGSQSTVGGGSGNSASGLYAAVSGGRQNTASGADAAIGGGYQNTVDEQWANVAGGAYNLASGMSSTISGGTRNHITGSGSVIGGGDYDTVSLAIQAAIGGGLRNYIGPTAHWATIAGGTENRILDESLRSTIGGGEQNAIAAHSACIPGGMKNAVTGPLGFAAGYRAKSQHLGTFVWADSTEADFVSTDEDQFLVRAAGGVGINTNVPYSPLTVHSNGKYRWSSGNGWGDFSVGAGAYGLCVGVALSGGGAGAVRIWPNGGAEQILFGNPTVGEIMDINPSGRIGFLGTSATNVLTLPNSNDVNGRALGYAWDTYSSRRWKKNIKTISGALGKVQALRGVEYDSKSNDEHDIGLIAEEVGEVIPEVVTYEDNGKDARSIEYAKLVAVLIEAVKEQQSQIKSQQNEINELRAQVESQTASR